MALRVAVYLRRSWRILVIASILVGVIGGLAMGIAAGTRRTESAPDRYTRAAGGDPDLVITQQIGTPLIDSIRDLHGVSSVQALVFVASFLMSPIDGTPVLEPNSFAGNDDAVGARVVSGRFGELSEPNGFTVNRPMAALLAKQFGTEVGDQFQVESFDQAQVLANFDSGTEHPAVPSFTATLVGITESPSEFDDGTPQMVFPLSFLATHPDVAVVQSLIAVHVAPGTDPAAIMKAVRQLPNGADAYAVPTRVVTDGARRAVGFQVTALWLVSAILALAAVIVIVQIISRALYVGDEERQSIVALGWRRVDLAAERSIEAALVIVLAAPIALAVLDAIASRFPLGVLRLVEPDPGARMDWAVGWLGLLVVATVVVATAAIAALRHGRPTRQRAVDGVGALIATRGLGMPMSVGTTFAAVTSRGRRPWGSAIGAAIGVAGLIGALVVGLSIRQIVSTPARWGVNYDQMFGNEYTNTDSDIVTPVAANADVVAVSGANVGSISINGSDVPTIAFDAAKGGLEPTVLSGRDPASPDEIALGAEVARRLHLHVGSTTTATGESGDPQTLTVVGIIVTPDNAGSGATMTFSGYRALNPSATENIILVRFRPDAPADAGASLAAANYTPPGSLSTPSSIKALQRVTAAPLLLALVLSVLL
ncbi:MAG TPA: hypothetical protein VGM78_11755, partial [Ilumatobacteraceae bacterium]